MTKRQFDEEKFDSLLIAYDWCDETTSGNKYRTNIKDFIDAAIIAGKLEILEKMRPEHSLLDIGLHRTPSYKVKIWNEFNQKIDALKSAIVEGKG